MELLYGNQRKALKFIYKAYKQKSTTTKVKLSKFLNLNFQETSQVCQELKNKGFISLVGVNFDPKITPNGIEYFSIETRVSLEAVLNSIVCPIIVSVVTTLITLLLSN
jgi:predicted transcriptional regulator